MKPDQEPEKAEEVLEVDKLVAGDVPSIHVIGVLAADSFRKNGAAFFASDVLGRIHVLSPNAVRILSRPRVTEDELDAMDEDQALDVMVSQGDSEEVMTKYLERRSSR